MSEGTLLEVRNLCVAVESEQGMRNLVEDLNLVVRPGEIVAVVGESGSGKSVSCMSLLNLLPGNVRFPSGVIQWDQGGSQLATSAGSEALNELRGKQIAVIFQEPMTALNPVKTCGDQVAESIRINGTSKGAEVRSEVLRLFTEVRLPRPEAMFDQYPHQLSGGQRQRVMIAMALACNPRLIIADEPTTALDVTVQRSVLDLIRDLVRERNLSMIFISHDLSLVAELADNILVMKSGRVVEQGPAMELLKNPQHEYTRALLACRPTPEAKGRPLMTIGSDVKTEANGNDTNEVSGEVLLEVKHLSKEYHPGSGWLKGRTTTVRAVSDISFVVYKGETLGLVGESGCGKTTLSRMLMGMIEPTEGEINYQGQKVTRSSWDRLRKKCQLVFQDPYSSLNPMMNVEDALAEVMLVHGVGGNSADRLNRCMKLMDQVGLPATSLGKYPHEFSGGQRQRIVIARALAVEPDFLICDEAVSALDVSVQAQVLNLLNDLRRELGLTYLFISHDLNVVYYMCDRIMVMQKGQIVESGTAEEVFYRASNPYTRLLIGAMPGGL